jgi:hypothetical protein
MEGIKITKMTRTYQYFELIAICLFILMLNSCIQSFVPDLNADDTESFLVVEGLITDEKGPFKVHLTKSGPVNQLYYQEPVTGADVMIVDNNGNSWQLTDNQNGWYETEDENLKGIPGTTYTLKINDGGGNNFESVPELMHEVPDIDSVYLEEVKLPRFENGLTYEDNWLNILLDTHDSTGKTMYWLWKFEETWEIRMLNFVHVLHGALDSPDKFYRDEQVKIDPEKEVCWVTLPSKSVLVESTATSMESDIKGFVIQSLGPGEDKLHIRYSIFIKQYSMNKELYDYWEQLKKLNEDAGGMYNTLPAPVYGNIQCVSGSKKVLGYFSASSVKTKRIFINSSDHHITTISPYENCIYLTDPNPYIYFRWVYFTTIANTDIKLWVYDDDYCTDCRDYGTNVKPDFWK